MEGVILANGDKADFDICVHTERSNPVVTLKIRRRRDASQESERRIGHWIRNRQIKHHTERGDKIKPEEEYCTARRNSEPASPSKA